MISLKMKMKTTIDFWHIKKTQAIKSSGKNGSTQRVTTKQLTKDFRIEPKEKLNCLEFTFCPFKVFRLSDLELVLQSFEEMSCQTRDT